MNIEQWNTLIDVIDGKNPEKPISAFIIDSPWLPGWYGCSTLDYYTNDQIWLEANFKAIDTFPETSFLPGFWSEYGMCTEPSAFGAKTIWEEKNLPHANKVITDLSELSKINKPDVRKDGLLPFTINRLKNTQSAINRRGHEIKFAVSRGPFNIATFLMGTTEFLMALKLDPEGIHKLLRIISDFTIDWLEYQIESFPTIDGILLLDDIIGFVGDEDFRDFMLPYLKEIYSHFPVKVKFLHNDADGIVSAPYLPEIGVNLFNFSFNHPIDEMKKLTANKVTLLGNIPPRDTLSLGTTNDIENWIEDKMNMKDLSRIIWSCGGGMSQDTSTENINAFINTVRNTAAAHSKPS